MKGKPEALRHGFLKVETTLFAEYRLNRKDE